MKRLGILAAAALITAITLLGWASLAHAQVFRSGHNATTSPNQKFQSTVFATGKTVDISSEVYGDVFCTGMNITVSGAVHGDVICAGQTVNVTGKVDGDVRLAGQTVNLSSPVGKNATIVAQTYVQDSRSTIGGDISVAASDATINGKVGRDVAVGAGNATIGNAVGRNIQANVTTLKLTADARVNGSIKLISKNNINKDPSAVVNGMVTRTEPKNANKSKHGAIVRFSLLWFIYSLLAGLFTALILALLFPRLFHAVTDRGMPRPWRPLATGFVATIVAPFIILLLAVTVIGIPLAIIASLLWIVVLFLSGPVFAYYLGRLILRNSTRPLLIMLVGALVLLILYFIPIIGFIAIAAALWIGTGMLLLELVRRTPRPVYHSVPARETISKPKR
jgi:hypothetical protein